MNTRKHVALRLKTILQLGIDGMYEDEQTQYVALRLKAILQLGIDGMYRDKRT